MLETSYVMVKPEFANKPEVIQMVKQRLQEHHISVVLEGYIKYTPLTAKKHYHEHVGRDYYQNLERYITSDKAYGMKVVGENAIETIRKLAGATKNPAEGTIRYDIPKRLGIERRVTENVIHSSDSEAAAKLELAVFEELLVNYHYYK